MFWFSVSCIRSHKSAGHMVVCLVTGLMVCDRRFPGATILGGRFSTSSANHSLPVPPTGSEPRDGLFFRGCSGTSVHSMIVDFPMDAVAGARRTPGRLKTGGVPPKPPATIFLSLWPSVFWDFGSLFRTLRRRFLTRCCGSRLLRPRRCGDFGLVSRHQPAEHRFLIFPLLPTLRCRVCFTRRRPAATSTLLTCRGAAAKSTPLTRRGATARSTPLHHSRNPADRKFRG